MPRIELNDEALSILSAYSDGSFEIPENEAIKVAKAVITDFTLESDTRSGSEPLSIKAVKALTSDNFEPIIQYSSRADSTQVIDVELPKVLGYAVNFSDDSHQDAGFVIVPADKRIGHTILAAVPAGCLPTSEGDVIENNGLAFFLDNAEEYVVWRIAEAERKADSLKQVLTQKYQSLYPNRTVNVVFKEASADTRATGNDILVQTTTTVEKDWWDTSCVAPLVPVEWGQGAPFNDHVKNKRACGMVVTGCVATAAAQFMAYWKYPPVVDGVTMDWDNMVKYTGITSWEKRNKKPGNKWVDSMNELPSGTPTREKTAHLMRYMGQSIGAEYHCGIDKCPSCGGGGTSATTGNVVDRLVHMGYRNTKAGTGFVFSKAKAAFLEEKPLLIQGWSDKVVHYFMGIKVGTSYKGGHAWLLDGYKERQRALKTVTVTIQGQTILDRQTTYHIENEQLIHNNWGWDGSNNGYFTAGVFDAFNRVLQSNGDRETRGTENNYKYKIWVWYNLSK